MLSETTTASPHGYARDIISALDGTWRTAGQIRQLLGYGQLFEVANCLEKLWRLGLIEQDAQDIGIGAKRKGGAKSYACGPTDRSNVFGCARMSPGRETRNNGKNIGFSDLLRLRHGGDRQGEAEPPIDVSLRWIVASDILHRERRLRRVLRIRRQHLAGMITHPNLVRFKGSVAANGSARASVVVQDKSGYGRLSGSQGRGDWSGYSGAARCEGYWMAQRN